ncbi:hypothetical protein LI90_3992 [Carbonactinospora thermoautotrophica]|uniref:Uncharacterized protein n=1 Tax=Carbonactinospora thermoautotrophica TaxID=1469144 RepID=A0A132MYP8_9ACTN|nr:hypothetical protein [Carbonactinospora thermoautotrophica]KWX02943.1 hypothetical protein LI90_3992 [Carbonactinospora thermoautotrophica]
MTDPLLAARALILHDLAAYGADTAEVVSLLDDVITERRWWVAQWPEGAQYVAGLAAQDMQDALLDRMVRWPVCQRHGGEAHELRIEPELGPDPHWVCEKDGAVVARLGDL